MVGEQDDRIHGRNRQYCVTSPENLHAFDLDKRGNPTTFNKQNVRGTNLLDHQGHIVPQNMYNEILNNVADDMAKNTNTDDEAFKYVEKNSKVHPWLPMLLDYAKGFGNGFEKYIFDWDVPDTDSRVGNLFAIAIWNPINLCRAPSDDYRNRYPGKEIDEQVVTYLSDHDSELNVDAKWLASVSSLKLKALKAGDSKNEPVRMKKLEDHITVCSRTLKSQLSKGTGFYKFQWHEEQKNVFFPGN